jgi:hypothetical protein
MAEEQQGVQEPEMPTKKPKKSGGGLSTPMWIGVIAGGLILNTVIIILAIRVFVEQPTAAVPQEGGKEHTEKVDNKHKSSDEHAEEGDEESVDDLEEENVLHGDDNVEFMETGRITTNPKGSTSFVILNLGLEYRKKHTEGEEGGGGHGGGAPAGPDPVMARVKGVINNTIGSMTVEQLQDREALRTKLRDDIRVVYKKHKIYLRDVVLVEFLIQ